jgi:hypothetical protein
MKKVAIFFVLLLISLNIQLANSDSEKFSVTEVYWAFEGTVQNQNGQQAEILFGVIELS